MNTVEILNENAQNCFESSKIERIDGDGAQNLIPNLCVPLNSAIYKARAVNIHPQHYLQALFLACENIVLDLVASGYKGKEIHLHERPVNTLLELEGDYDAVIVCLGANTDTISKLSGKLPLRTCRGVVAHMELLNNIRLSRFVHIYGKRHQFIADCSTKWFSHKQTDLQASTTLWFAIWNNRKERKYWKISNR